MPGGIEPRRVRLLTSGMPVRFDQTGSVLTLIVPSVEVHEVIAIDV
jgi:hypothetical protein